MDTVQATAEFIAGMQCGESFFIGGGEPTLHPKFWDIVDIVKDCNADWAEENGVPPVQLVTNGSNTETVMRLVQMAYNDEAYVRLSRDQFHYKYPIDPGVIGVFQAYDGYPRSSLYVPRTRAHRNLEVGAYIHNVENVGRARYTGWSTKERGCDGIGPIITPNGKIWRCSCRNECIGDVFRGLACDPVLIHSSDVGCTLRDGKLIRDPRSNLLNRRSDMEAAGWIFNPNVFEGQLEFDLNSERFKDTHHGAYSTTSQL
jgi:hypothetical protein